MKKAKIMAILMTLGLILISVATITTISRNPAEGSITQPQIIEELILTESQIEQYKITDSVEGEQKAQETLSRWKQDELCSPYLDTQDLEVYKFAEGDFLIVPSSTEVRVKYSRLSDGSTSIVPSVAVGLSSNPQYIEDYEEGSSSNAQSKSTGWGYWHHHCWTVENSYAVMDACAWIEKLYGDPSPTVDFFALHLYATAKSKGVWKLRTAYLTSERHTGFAPMLETFDWNPKSDLNVGNCQQRIISISVLGFQFSSTHEVCDKWDITKYTEAGKFKNTWIGKAWGSEREVAFMIAVTVPKYGNPGWWLEAGYTCSLF